MGGADQLAGRAAGADRDAPDPFGTVSEDERLAADRLPHAAGEILDADLVGQRPALADLSERSLDRDAELPREQRVVAELRMSVERGGRQPG